MAGFKVRRYRILRGSERLPGRGLGLAAGTRLIGALRTGQSTYVLLRMHRPKRIGSISYLWINSA